MRKMACLNVCVCVVESVDWMFCEECWSESVQFGVVSCLYTLTAHDINMTKQLVIIRPMNRLNPCTEHVTERSRI